MEKFFYSAQTNSAYPEALKDAYLESKSWPADSVEIDSNIYAEFFMSYPPAGKVRAPGKNGQPVWVDIPALSKDELVTEAESKKQYLLSVSNSVIQPLSYAVDTGIATDNEIRLYNEWRKYSVLLNRIDTSLAPKINWPTQPII
ncbi:tail fiber assembly protein [Limnobaculum zhutongyuii]|uniref:Tail fiber assembly protein n=1 Tax=Limnobaculum zhutongyuii TaxID=2498113 RepID=A0A411WII7_9GAMM|nr:tail fiber assembly protein [Limnobaculum zhutongyuii]QBH96003.1 tail fiber assembly protein [Limnobaculum zhutongyuii]TQS89286.1 tail fiber assembly protein [Limnobaculum zhutongyuii]